MSAGVAVVGYTIYFEVPIPEGFTASEKTDGRGAIDYDELDYAKDVIDTQLRTGFLNGIKLNETERADYEEVFYDE